MTKNIEPSLAIEFLLKPIAKALAPATEANRLRQQLNVRSLEDTCDALAKAGYQIYRADLPPNVRGFAEVIHGEPYIVTNRCDCWDEHRFTVSHELGHHVLHKNPSSAIAKLGLADESEEDRELRANQFAEAWVKATATPEQRQRLFGKNREANSASADAFMDLFFMILPFVLIYVITRLFSKNSVA